MHKTQLNFLIMSFLLIGLLGNVLAEEIVTASPTLYNEKSVELTTETENNVILPKARKVGSFGDFADRMRLAFTFNQEKKIERSLEMAEKRLAEIEALAEENPEKAEQSRERYEFFLGKAEQTAEKMENKKEGENASKEHVRNIVNAQKRLEEHKAKANGIYNRALTNMQENNASSEKIDKLEEIYQKVNERNAEFEEKIIAKKENAKTTYKVKSEKSDDDLNAEWTEMEKDLIKIKENRQIKEQETKRHLEQIRTEERNKLRNQLRENTNLSQEEKEMIQNRLIKVNKKMIQNQEMIPQINVIDSDIDEQEMEENNDETGNGNINS